MAASVPAPAHVAGERIVDFGGPAACLWKWILPNTPAIAA